MRLGNGKWETTQFNSRLQATQIGLGHSATDTGLWKANYEYGEWESGAINQQKNNGNLARQTFIVPTIGTASGFTAVQTYSYDKLDRVQSAVETVGGVEKWKQTFDYDRFGNKRFNTANTTLLSVESNVPKVANPEVLATNNQYKPDQDNDGVNDYLYDVSGNITKDAQNRIFTYDGENRQTSAVGNNLSVSYAYDGNDKRVKSFNAVTNQTTIFVYDADGQLAAEYTINVPPPTSPTISYLTEDALGSVRVVTNSFGEVKARRDFLPFGEEIYAGIGNRTTNQKYSANGDDTRKKFATYQRDAETGLDYAQSRYYSPMFGRFTSPDEFKGGPDELFDFEKDASSNPTFYADLTNPQSLNKYQYTYNNPLNMTDSDGHCPPVIAGIVIVCAILLGPDTVNAPGPGDPVYINERGANAALNLLGFKGGSGLLTAIFKGVGGKNVAKQAGNQVAKQTVKQTPKQTAKQTTKQTTKLTANQAQRGINSYQKQISKHQQKLKDYIKNPDKHDNKGLLKKASTPQQREQIIQGRINSLKREIKKFENEIEKLKRSQ